jgi:chromosome segregation ATPase
MRASNGMQSPQTQTLDWVFTMCQGGNAFTNPSPSSDCQPAGAVEGLPLTEVEPAPAIQGATDLRAANDWLQRERRRLQEYTRIQLDRIQREHQALVGQKYLNEQTTILLSQELSRKEELLAQQTRALQQQTAELSQRERFVAAQLEQWSKVQNDLANLCEVRVNVELDTEQQQALLESLRQESDALQKSREASQSELEALARALNEQRDARTREQGLNRAHQARMEERLNELEKAEQATQRRVAELDELEIQLREEFEEQERQLAEQRSEVAALYSRLRRRLEEESREPASQFVLADSEH